MSDLRANEVAVLDESYDAGDAGFIGANGRWLPRCASWGPIPAGVRAVVDVSVDEFDTLLLIGGGGLILDTNNCWALHELICGCYHDDRLVACECDSLGVLPFTQYPDSGRVRTADHPPEPVAHLSQLLEAGRSQHA